MRANGIVVTAPTLDDDLGLPQRVEDLAIEQLVSQARVEALDNAVFPRAAWRNVGGLCPDRADPLLYCVGEEFGAVVGTDVLGNATQNEQVGQDVDDVDRFEPVRYPTVPLYVALPICNTRPPTSR